MQRHRNFAVALSVALPLLFVLAARGDEGGPLEIWVGSQTDAAYYTQMTKRYRDEHGGAEPVIRAFGYVEMPDKLAVAIKSGVGTPDIVQLDESQFSIYLKGEVPFVDLAERLASSGLAEEILPQRVSLFAYRGSNYGVPQSLSAVALYYRADLFEQWDLAPEKLRSWSQFVAEGKRVRAAGGPGLVALDWSYFEILLHQRGHFLFDEAGEPLLDDPAALDLLEWLTELNASRVGIQPDRGSIFEPVFFSGDIANAEVMAIIGADWYGLDMLKNLSPQLAGQWRAMPLPSWSARESTPQAKGRRTSAFSGQGLLIHKDSKKVDLAWHFIEWVMKDRRANLERFTQGNAVTAHMPSWSDPGFQARDPFFGGQRFAAQFISLATEMPELRSSPHKAKLVNLWRETYWAALMFGHSTPRATLESLQRALTGKAPAQPKADAPN